MAQMNLSMEQKQTHGHREQTCGCQGGGSGRECDFGVRCKLLHLEWKSNEVLLYSTGNYIQSLVMEHDGRCYEKKNVCIYIYICMHKMGSLCCTL